MRKTPGRYLSRGKTGLHQADVRTSRRRELSSRPFAMSALRNPMKPIPRRLAQRNVNGSLFSPARRSVSINTNLAPAYLRAFYSLSEPRRAVRLMSYCALSAADNGARAWSCIRLRVMETIEAIAKVDGQIIRWKLRVRITKEYTMAVKK